MASYKVLVTFVDYYGYEVGAWDPRTVEARTAAEAKQAVKHTLASWPRYTLKAVREGTEFMAWDKAVEINAATAALEAKWAAEDAAKAR